jgi:hypothetical protein
MTETALCDIRFRDRYLVCLFLSFEHYCLEFVSDFDIRISNLNNLYHRSLQSQFISMGAIFLFERRIP